MTFPTVKAEGLHSAAPAEDYKTLRMQEMLDIMKAEAPDLYEYRTILLAHLFTENGALAEDIHGDWNDNNRPCSLGILQMNACVHFKMNVHRFLEAYPQYRDWRAQFRMYLLGAELDDGNFDGMQQRLTRYGDIDTAVASWNFGAAPHYLQKVKRNVAIVKSISNRL